MKNIPQAIFLGPTPAGERGHGDPTSRSYYRSCDDDECTVCSRADVAQERQQRRSLLRSIHDIELVEELERRLAAKGSRQAVQLVAVVASPAMNGGDRR